MYFTALLRRTLIISPGSYHITQIRVFLNPQVIPLYKEVQNLSDYGLVLEIYEYLTQKMFLYFDLVYSPLTYGTSLFLSFIFKYTYSSYVFSFLYRPLYSSFCFTIKLYISFLLFQSYQHFV